MPTSAQNTRGEWVPAIPEPYWLSKVRRGKCQCSCDRIFPTLESYRGHYALIHVLAYKN